MAQGRAKPLLATESGQDVTDKFDGQVREIAIFSPPVEDLLQQIVDRLDIIIEQNRVIKEGL
jgi:hypothetical protein